MLKMYYVRQFICVAFTFLGLVERRYVLSVFVSIGIKNPRRLRQDHSPDAAKIIYISIYENKCSKIKRDIKFYSYSYQDQLLLLLQEGKDTRII